MNNGIKELTVLAIHVFIAGMYYLWQMEGVEQAGNIFIFWVWFVGVAGSISIFIVPTANDYRPRTLIRGFIRFVVAPLTLLATLWAGHIAAATFYAISVLAAEVRHRKAKELAEVK